MTKKELKSYLEAEVFTVDKKNFSSFFYQLKEFYLNPSRHAIYLIRKMQYHASKGDKLSIYRALLIQKKLLHKYSMHISPYCKIGVGLHIPHPVGIVIGSSVVIGERCSIYQNVTIGGARTGDAKKKNQPIISDNVTVFAGSMILGKVYVHENIIIASNSVLIKDTECTGKVYAGNPARKVK